MIEIPGTPFVFDSAVTARIDKLHERVYEMRTVGRLSEDVLNRIRKYFRIKTIYHSNAIEGNTLDVGETRQVVEVGLTIAGKPLKDQAEAKNLGEAVDFLEDLAKDPSESISLHDVRQIHQLILRGIDNDNAGAIRTIEVAISGSDFRPPEPHNVAPQMNDLFDWLESATENPLQNVIQTAAAFHAWFAQIHPFVDGNGRTARIVTNLLLMRAHYPIAVITREDRIRYYEALEESQGSDLTSFIVLLLETVEETLEEYEAAAEEQREHLEWAASLASRFSGRDEIRVKNEYEVWRSAMDLLLNHYRQVVETVNDQLPVGKWYLKDFGMLPYEKYLALRQRQFAKRTWFFRVDFVPEGRSAVRYLHFFGFTSYAMSGQSKARVSLHLSREETPFYFERLDDITSPDVPPLREIAYSPADEAFIARHGLDQCFEQKIERIAEQFFENVINLHFDS